MTEIKLFGGDFGGDVMHLQCNLSQASSTVRWHSGDGKWRSSQYQCADCRHRTEGLAEVGRSIAAVALELPQVECEWEEVQ
jgi:hypothetical protein